MQDEPKQPFDIWRTASDVLHLYGDDAALHVSLRADSLLRRGDVEGFHTWLRIGWALDAIRRPPHG